MKYSSFKYLFKQGWNNFKENRLMSVASIGVVSSCLIIVGVCGLLALNVNAFVSYLGSQNEIIVYVKDDVEQEIIDNMTSSINQNENISEVVFVSKDEALMETMGYLEDYSNLLEGYQGDNNPIPASFRCKIKDLEQLQKTCLFLSQIEGVDYVSSSSELVDVLITIKEVTYYSGLAVLTILVLVSMVVIANTIRLTVFARRKEISIMKYVGATNGFIRLPFVVEGLLIGTISALLTFAFVSGGYYYLYTYITEQATGWIATLSLSLVTYKDIWYIMLTAFLGFGWIIGSVGSVVSMKKYLEV